MALNVKSLKYQALRVDNYVYFCEYFDLTEGNYWRSYMMGMNKTNLYMEVTGEFRLTGGLSNNQGFLIRC